MENGRNKRSIAINLKHSAGVKIVKDLCCAADILIEPYRPGVMEKLGLGPQDCLGLNPRLVYARLTGFGQSGPLAHRAGHDINFLAISGVLSVSTPNAKYINFYINFIVIMYGISIYAVHVLVYDADAWSEKQ